MDIPRSRCHHILLTLLLVLVLSRVLLELPPELPLYGCHYFLLLLPLDFPQYGYLHIPLLLLLVDLPLYGCHRHVLLILLVVVMSRALAERMAQSLFGYPYQQPLPPPPTASQPEFDDQDHSLSPTEE